MNGEGFDFEADTSLVNFPIKSSCDLGFDNWT
jgi:hypothetical protein